MTDSLLDQIPIIAEHAQAIGYVCVLYATMEVSLDALLETIVPFETGQVSDSIAANVDLREKLRILKAVAFVRKPNQKWYDTIDELVDCVDTDLRNARNRYIHDLWAVGAPGIVKRTRRTNIQKPQAHKPDELITFTEAPVKAEEIWNLALRIRVVERAARMLRLDFLEARRAASPAKSL